MDLSLHIAAAAWTCSATLYGESRLQKRSLSRGWSIALGIVCFFLSLYTHLLLDLIPHYDFVYKFLRFPWLPHLVGFGWTLFKVGVTTCPVVFLFLALNSDHPVIALAAIAGGIYPDIEKTLYLHEGLPRWFVISPRHSGAYSPVGWEYTHKFLITGLEVSLFVMFIAGMYWFARWRRHSKGIEDLFRLLGDLFIVIRLLLITFKEENLMKLKWLTVAYIMLLVSVMTILDFELLPTPRNLVKKYAPDTFVAVHFPQRLPYDDKLAHFFLVGALALLVNLSLSLSQVTIRKIKILKGSLVLLVLVTLEEFSQMLFPARSFSWFDLFANYAGILCFGRAAIYLMTNRAAIETKIPYVKGEKL